jgi:hypothetical protein
MLSGDFVLPKIFPGEDGAEGGESTDSPEKPRSSSKKSAGAAGSSIPRIPPPVEGIQVNFCKAPTCSNFGVPPNPISRRGPGSSSHDTYVLSGGISKRGTPRTAIKCKLCGDTPPLKSNLAIAQEVARLMAYLDGEPEPSCQNSACAQFGLGVHSNRSRYMSHGRTAHGSPRFRCKECGSTFAVGGPTTGQKKPHENREIFMELVNKAPFRRIMEKRDICAATLYGKIDFLFAQCLRFLGDREGKLLERLPLGHLSISVDRQDYYTNWTRREDKRNIPLHSVVSADNRTGYVFGAHLNFDPRFDPEEVEADVRLDDDDLLPQEYRRNARFWLKSDYDASIAATAARKRYKGKNTVLDAAAARYATAADREDVEVSDEFDREMQLPGTGMQVHGEYTLYAHFQVLKRSLAGAQSITFYLDQDAGMRAACFAAFHEEIQHDFVHAFFVTVKKEMTKGQKLAAFNEAQKRFAAAKASMGLLDDEFIKIALIKEQLPLMKEIGGYKDKWLLHPLPTMNEPEKALAYLTARPDSQVSEDQLAKMYLYGSMYGADRFMELIRRRLSPLERALSSSSAAGRMWYGYAPYNPRIIEKLLLLLRVYWNYCFVPKGSKDGKTPAERLGLAKGKLRVEDILYFDGNKKP